jgi:hypothetical protein
MLHSFRRPEIGFVFSNRQAGETPDLLFAICYCLLLAILHPLYAISIGWLIGFVSLCFFLVSSRSNFNKPLSLTP